MRSLILWVGALALMGCGGPDHDTICQEMEDCVGGNDADVEACVIQLDAIADLAGSEGCGDEYDEYILCAEERAKCDSQDTGQNCASNADCQGIGSGNATCTGNTCRVKSYGLQKDDDCEAEQNAYSRCSDINLEID